MRKLKYMLTICLAGWVMIATTAAHSSVIESLGATVDIKFFEAPSEGVSFESRAYSTRFVKQSTRFVSYELRLELPAPGTVVEIPLTIRYLNFDGSLFHELSHPIVIQPDSIRPWYSWEVGWSDPGKWPVGGYTVKVFEAEREIVSGTFSIVESSLERSGFPVTIDESTVDYFLPVPEFSERPFSLKRSYDPFGVGADWFESSIIQPGRGGLRTTGLDIDDTDYWLDMQIDLSDPALPLKIIDIQPGDPKTPYPDWLYGNEFVDFRMSRADIFGPPPYFSIFDVGIGGIRYNLDFMFNNTEFVLTGITDSGYIHYIPDTSAPELGVITSSPEPPVLLTDQEGLCFANVPLGAPVAFLGVDLPQGEDYVAVKYCSETVIQKFNVLDKIALGAYAPVSGNKSGVAKQVLASSESGWSSWLPPSTPTVEEQLEQCIQDQTTLNIGLGRDNELSDGLYNLAKSLVFSDKIKFSNKTMEGIRTALKDNHDLIVNALSSGRMDENDLTVFVLKTAVDIATPKEREYFKNYIFDNNVPEYVKEISIGSGTASTEEQMYKQALLGLTKGVVKIIYPKSSALCEAIIEAQKWSIEVMADEDIRIMYQQFKNRNGNWEDFYNDSIRARPNASIKIKLNLKNHGKQCDDPAAWNYTRTLFESWYRQEDNFPSKLAELEEIKERYLDTLSYDVRDGVKRLLPYSTECDRFKLVLDYFNRAMLDLSTSALNCDPIPGEDYVRDTAWRMVQDQFGNLNKEIANKNYQKTKLDFLKFYDCLHIEEREEEDIIVPNVVGLTQPSAEQVIAQVGLVAAVTTAYHDTVPAGQVISQNPVAGASVAPGSTVNIVVSLGPDTTAYWQLVDVIVEPVPEGKEHYEGWSQSGNLCNLETRALSEGNFVVNRSWYKACYPEDSFFSAAATWDRPPDRIYPDVELPLEAGVKLVDYDPPQYVSLSWGVSTDNPTVGCGFGSSEARSVCSLSVHSWETETEQRCNTPLVVSTGYSAGQQFALRYCIPNGGGYRYIYEWVEAD